MGVHMIRCRIIWRILVHICWRTLVVRGMRMGFVMIGERRGRSIASNATRRMWRIVKFALWTDRRVWFGISFGGPSGCHHPGLSSLVNPGQRLAIHGMLLGYTSPMICAMLRCCKSLTSRGRRTRTRRCAHWDERGFIKVGFFFHTI